METFGRSIFRAFDLLKGPESVQTILRSEMAPDWLETGFF